MNRTAPTPFGLTFLSPPPHADPTLFAAARLDPTTQLAYLHGRPLHEVVPPIAMAPRPTLTGRTRSPSTPTTPPTDRRDGRAAGSGAERGPRSDR